MTFGEFFWGLLFFYLIFFYLMTLFRIFGDLFSDPDTSGFGKAAWIIFLLFIPFLSMIIYLITRGRRMAERTLARAEASNASQQEYIRRVAGNNGHDPASQIAKAHELLDSGAITRAEFDALKAKVLA
jgi:hypothetical protein